MKRKSSSNEDMKEFEVMELIISLSFFSELFSKQLKLFEFSVYCEFLTAETFKTLSSIFYNYLKIMVRS